MKMETCAVPAFFLDSVTGTSDTVCRELIRHIEIKAGTPEIFVWLKQLRIAPYSYDFIDNRGKKSPDFIIENLPPLRTYAHFLLVFNILKFEENSFIAGRFCEPVNRPVNLYMKDMYIEYRIVRKPAKSELWCKIKGNYYNDIFSRGFFRIFSAVNKIMTARQLKNIKKLAELAAAGKVETGKYDLKNYFIKSGIHWWIFCRRHNCKGLIT
jgi:hypothetical protein